MLGVPVKTLSAWRCRGHGPEFIRLAPKTPRYRRSAVLAFIAARAVPREHSRRLGQGVCRHLQQPKDPRGRISRRPRLHLRAHAERRPRSNGRHPSTRPLPWFVADTLRIAEAQAIEGIARAIKAGLIAIDDSDVVICGWDTEWAKRQITEAERKRMQRARIRASGQSPDNVRTDVPAETCSTDDSGPI